MQERSSHVPYRETEKERENRQKKKKKKEKRQKKIEKNGKMHSTVYTNRSVIEFAKSTRRNERERPIERKREEEKRDERARSRNTIKMIERSSLPLGKPHVRAITVPCDRICRST